MLFDCLCLVTLLSYSQVDFPRADNVRLQEETEPSEEVMAQNLLKYYSIVDD